jgi:hypothetical protein
VPLGPPTVVLGRPAPCSWYPLPMPAQRLDRIAMDLVNLIKVWDSIWRSGPVDHGVRLLRVDVICHPQCLYNPGF